MDVVEGQEKNADYEPNEVSDEEEREELDVKDEGVQSFALKVQYGWYEGDKE